MAGYWFSGYFIGVACCFAAWGWYEWETKKGKLSLQAARFIISAVCVSFLLGLFCLPG